jgi:hypothetical protein
MHLGELPRELVVVEGPQIETQSKIVTILHLEKKSPV